MKSLNNYIKDNKSSLIQLKERLTTDKDKIVYFYDIDKVYDYLIEKLSVFNNSDKQYDFAHIISTMICELLNIFDYEYESHVRSYINYNFDRSLLKELINCKEYGYWYCEDDPKFPDDLYNIMSDYVNDNCQYYFSIKIHQRKFIIKGSLNKTDNSYIVGLIDKKYNNNLIAFVIHKL